MSGVHEMYLNGPMENGVGEWICYECGRRVLEKHTPIYRQTILFQGNMFANHASVIGNKKVTTRTAMGDFYRTEQDDEWLTANGMAWETNGT
jgi:hypothetical protein